MKLKYHSLLLVVLSSVHISFAALSFGFPYGKTKVRGVNLGGWLVIESWITPSLFDATNNSQILDEYTFGKYQQPQVAAAALKAHWDTWITEQDFKNIAAAGLNHVRIPIGYWAFDVSAGEPYIQGQLPYLTKAVKWASKYKLKVIVDLHGAPGSENGFDNSGQATPTIPMGTVPGLLAVLKQFYYDAYGSIRWAYGTARQSKLVVIISDAFLATSYWRGWMPYPNWEGVIIDTHIYQVFSNYENAYTWNQHIAAACARSTDMTSSSLWQIVGEWSPASTDCVNSREFFSRGSGSRYEGTYPGSTRVGSCTGLTGKSSTFSAEYKAFLRRFWEAQVITYEKAQGWVQWTWKAENADDWSYQAGLAGGWIPQNPTSLKYPKICG